MDASGEGRERDDEIETRADEEVGEGEREGVDRERNVVSSLSFRGLCDARDESSEISDDARGEENERNEPKSGVVGRIVAVADDVDDRADDVRRIPDDEAGPVAHEA